jgi:hypothetical protein
VGQTITVTIDLDGQAVIEADGYKGKACEQATAELLKALGGKQKASRKPEYHHEEKARKEAGRC